MSDTQDSMYAALYWQSEDIRTLRASLAELLARAEKAEAELAELKSPGKIASQLKAVRDVLGVPDTLSRPLHLYVADLIASRDRLRTLELARIRLGRAQLTRDARMKQEAREVIKAAFAAVDAAGDLGGAA